MPHEAIQRMKGPVTLSFLRLPFVTFVGFCSNLPDRFRR